jgi:hypothetical protein
MPPVSPEMDPNEESFDGGHLAHLSQLSGQC